MREIDAICQPENVGKWYWLGMPADSFARDVVVELEYECENYFFRSSRRCHHSEAVADFLERGGYLELITPPILLAGDRRR